MAHLTPGETRRFNAEPIDAVDEHLDIDYVGDGIRAHRLDVLVPSARHAFDPRHRMPVYVYFHGGGWTSGDKAPLTKYCASQAEDGIVVVNVNYRMASRFHHMEHMLEDANAALRWVTENIEQYGGDATRIVLGGDSAGGQIAALLAASLTHPELRDHYRLPAVDGHGVRGLVVHCGAVDFSVLFERGFILSLDFVRMLLPHRADGHALRKAARFLSPIDWLDPTYPPVLVTTSERDYFYRANLNFIRELRGHGVRVETVIFDRGAVNTRHTWQQDSRHPESQEVYQRLQEFVSSVTRVQPVA